MAPVAKDQRFITFARASALDAAMLCIACTVRTGHPICRKPSCKRNREKATRRLKAIWKAVATKARSFLKKLLKEYALLRACRNLHDKRLKNSEELERIVKQWYNELTTTIPSTKQPCHTSLAEAEFAPYPGGSTLEEKISQPLTSKCRDTGDLYLFIRPSSPGFGKIGYTTIVVEDRLKEWKRNCGYESKLVYVIKNVPHVYRVEAFIQAVLRKDRRYEIKCNRGDGCEAQHKEWFEGDVENTKRAMDDCVLLMRTAELYDANGLLHDNWANTFEQLKKDGAPISLEVLLDIARHGTYYEQRGLV